MIVNDKQVKDSPEVKAWKAAIGIEVKAIDKIKRQVSKLDAKREKMYNIIAMHEKKIRRLVNVELSKLK